MEKWKEGLKELYENIAIIKSVGGRRRLPLEGRTLSNYIENLIKRSDSKMIVRKNDMVIIKEGIDWTIYLGEYPCSNGRIEDVAKWLNILEND